MLTHLAPYGLVYDKKLGVFRTPDINYIIAEIARHMGRSRPAVQMLWMRAIRKLQEALV